MLILYGSEVYQDLKNFDLVICWTLKLAIFQTGKSFTAIVDS